MVLLITNNYSDENVIHLSEDDTVTSADDLSMMVRCGMPPQTLMLNQTCDLLYENHTYGANKIFLVSTIIEKSS